MAGIFSVLASLGIGRETRGRGSGFSSTACPSPGRHPHRVHSDGGDDRQQVSRACLAIMHNCTMVFLFLSLLGALRSVFRTRAELALENLASARSWPSGRHTRHTRHATRCLRGKGVAVSQSNVDVRVVNEGAPPSASRPLTRVGTTRTRRRRREIESSAVPSFAADHPDKCSNCRNAEL